MNIIQKFKEFFTPSKVKELEEKVLQLEQKFPVLQKGTDLVEEIEKNNWSLIPSKYIEFVDRDSKIDYDKEMKRIQKQFSSILAEEKDSQEKLMEAFKHLGYEIEL